MSNAPIPLSYASPFIHDDHECRVELGPLTLAALITLAACDVIYIGLAAIVLLCMGGHLRGLPVALFIAATAFVYAGLRLLILIRFRNGARILTAGISGIVIRDPTRSRVRQYRAHWIEDIRVRRSWWRPWMYQVEMLPSVAFFSEHNRSPMDFILTIGTDREKLADVARVVRGALHRPADRTEICGSDVQLSRRGERREHFAGQRMGSVRN